MPSLVRPQEQRRVVRQRAARRCAARPLFAKIELQSAWDQVQALAQGGEWVGAGLDGGMLERLRARLPSFLNARPTPDRSRLSSVESFFRYTEEEGRRFFEELDRDGDGRVRLDDLRVCMRCARSSLHAGVQAGELRAAEAERERLAPGPVPWQLAHPVAQAAKAA